MLPHKYGFRKLEDIHSPPGQTELPGLLREVLSLWLMAAGLAVIGISVLGYVFDCIVPEQLVTAPAWFLPLEALGYSHLQLFPLCGGLWLGAGVAVQKEKTLPAVVLGAIALTASMLISL